MDKLQPLNWQDIRFKYSFQVEESQNMVPHLESMEIGADAMFEALKKQGHYIKEEDDIVKFEAPTGNILRGWFVYIPEEPL